MLILGDIKEEGTLNINLLSYNGGQCFLGTLYGHRCLPQRTRSTHDNHRMNQYETETTSRKTSLRGLLATRAPFMQELFLLFFFPAYVAEWSRDTAIHHPLLPRNSGRLKVRTVRSQWMYFFDGQLFAPLQNC